MWGERSRPWGDVPAFLGLHVLNSFACALGESALPGRVPPPGGPVKVRRTVETMGDVPAFLGPHVFNSFACALGESALPFAAPAESPTLRLCNRYHHILRHLTIRFLTEEK